MDNATNRYLDLVKKQLDITSDNALAVHWKISPQRIYQYRVGRSEFSEDRALDVAEILGIPPEQILIEIQAERARKAGNFRLSAVLESVLLRLNLTRQGALFAALFALLFLVGFNGSSLSLGAPAIASVHFTDNVNYARLLLLAVLIFGAKFAALKVNSQPAVDMPLLTGCRQNHDKKILRLATL